MDISSTWEKLQNVGVHSDISKEERLRTKMMNSAVAFSIPVLFCFIAFAIFRQNPPLVLTYSLMTASFSAFMVFHYFKKYYHSRIIIVYLITIQYSIAGYYFQDCSECFLLVIAVFVILTYRNDIHFNILTFFIACSFVVVRMLPPIPIHKGWEQPVYIKYIYLFDVVILFIFYLQGFKKGYYLFSDRLIKANEKLSTNIIDLSKRETELIIQKEQLDELNKSKTQLLSIIVHDVRQPLVNLVDLLHNIDKLKEQNIDIDTFYSNILTKANSIKDSIDDMVGFVRLKNNNNPFIQNEWIDVNFHINSIIKNNEVQISKKGLKVINNCDDADIIYGNIVCFQSIVRNLLSNAIKFSYNGGTIKIQSDKLITQYLMIYFIDEGKGMTAEEIDHILNKDSVFSTLGTNNEKGIGLGMQLVKDMIKMSRGYLYIQPNIPKGLIAHVSFPTGGK